MKQNRGLLIVLLIIVVVVLGGSLLFQAWNKFVDDSNKVVMEDEYFTTIDVLSDNAAVEIIPTDSSITTVEYVGKKRKNAKFDFNAVVSNKTLTVEFKEKRWNFLRFDLSFSKMELLVKVPEKQYELIKIKSNNGKIKAENLEVKDISFETDNGSIELKNVDAVSTNIQSNNGKIMLEQVDGEIIGKTDNGRIMLATNDLDRPIDLATANGRIEIMTENEPTNGIIDVKTDNGKIDIFGEKNEHTVFGKGEHLIKLRSDNGRITITK
ncbi:DUF4097 family beta strand repeat-containing protein [Sporosarcina jiandibaonis]|uniref:DUF4097 family beta strand repeat-containing protein n=1 Tax=Sporosarcina jiandibaonis TaxID=2715535 RepID=UPI001554B0BD|nr:DUF4097 family beta strand repeat-containing protein [Sporosarcina jiandibaonis]